MASPVEFRFEIKAYTPETIPLERLARYLDNIAVLLGEPQNVHLARIEGGSTVPVIRIDWESIPRVKKRVNDVRNQEGPAEAVRARIAIEKDLAEDNAQYGELVDQRGARIIRFPGREKLREVEYGPFNQFGTLDGVPILVGGENDPVPVHLQDRGQQTHNCLASRPLAKAIGHYLFTSPLRVEGLGRWFRSAEGVWSMRRFVISGFRELKAESVHDATQRLRGIDAAWKSRPDPIGDLVALRGSEDD